MEMGYSDHFAVVMNVSINISDERFFSQKCIDVFNCQLSSELWSGVYLQT
jgi:hypothetical protein